MTPASPREPGPTAPVAHFRPPRRYAAGAVWTRRVVGAAALVVLLVASILLLRRPLPAPAHPVSPGITTVSLPGGAAPRVGHYAPELTAATLSGASVTLAQFRGKIILLNFWYAACDPCRIEMPTLERTYEREQGSGVVVLGIDTIDGNESIAQFQQAVGITYPVVRDVGHRSAAAYGVLGTPTSYLIDRHGVIRAVYVGPVNPSTLKSDLASLLASPDVPTAHA